MSNPIINLDNEFEDSYLKQVFAEQPSFGNMFPDDEDMDEESIEEAYDYVRKLQEEIEL